MEKALTGYTNVNEQIGKERNRQEKCKWWTISVMYELNSKFCDSMNRAKIWIPQKYVLSKNHTAVTIEEDY